MHFTQNSHNDPNKSSTSPTSKFDLSQLFINTSKANFAGGLPDHMTQCLSDRHYLTANGAADSSKVDGIITHN
jgi:hypothetical protein